jgi:hypothetical protein
MACRSAVATNFAALGTQVCFKNHDKNKEGDGGAETDMERWNNMTKRIP